MIENQHSQYEERNDEDFQISSSISIQSPKIGKNENMELKKLEIILCKNGKEWTQEEREFLVYFFFYQLGLIEKFVIWLNCRGIPETDAEILVTNLIVKFLKNSLPFDPNNEENQGKTLIDKFRVYLRMRRYNLMKDYYSKICPEGGIVPLEQINENNEEVDITDKIKLSELNQRIDQVWNDLEHNIKENAELEYLEKLDELRESDWQTAKGCLKNLPKKQRIAVELLDFKGLKSKEVERITGEKDGNIRRNANAGRKKMSECLSKKGIKYLELINENEKKRNK